ncbi:unnamed protein product [Diplocarpon coronariae]
MKLPTRISALLAAYFMIGSQPFDGAADKLDCKDFAFNPILGVRQFTPPSLVILQPISITIVNEGGLSAVVSTNALTTAAPTQTTVPSTTDFGLSSSFSPLVLQSQLNGSTARTSTDLSTSSSSSSAEPVVASSLDLSVSFAPSTTATLNLGSTLRTSVSASTSASLTTTRPKPQVVPAANGYRYVGCYTEVRGGGRALDGQSLPDDANTIEKCTAACAPYKYAGAEYGRECYCDDELNALSTTSSDAQCGMPCEGNDQEVCGGTGRLSVYERIGSNSTTQVSVSSIASQSSSSSASTDRALSASNSILASKSLPLSTSPTSLSASTARLAPSSSSVQGRVTTITISSKTYATPSLASSSAPSLSAGGSSMQAAMPSTSRSAFTATLVVSPSSISNTLVSPASLDISDPTPMLAPIIKTTSTVDAPFQAPSLGDVTSARMAHGMQPISSAGTVFRTTTESTSKTTSGLPSLSDEPRGPSSLPSVIVLNPAFSRMLTKSSWSDTLSNPFPATTLAAPSISTPIVYNAPQPALLTSPPTVVSFRIISSTSADTSPPWISTPSDPYPPTPSIAPPLTITPTPNLAETIASISAEPPADAPGRSTSLTSIDAVSSTQTADPSCSPGIPGAAPCCSLHPSAPWATQPDHFPSAYSPTANTARVATGGILSITAVPRTMPSSSSSSSSSEPLPATAAAAPSRDAAHATTAVLAWLAVLTVFL